MTVIDYNLYCSRCRGGLRGAELHGACPHCHATIAETVNIAVLDADTHTVAVDVACVGCGYNLRTLGVDAKCPECGAGVLESIRPDDLCFADAWWLKRVRGGVTNLLLASGAWLLFLLLIVTGSSARGSDGRLISGGVWVFGLVMCVTGVVRATTRDLHPRTPRGVLVAGRIARICCLLPVLWLASLVFISLPFTSWIPSAVFSVIQLLAITAGPICLWICLRHLAIRGGRPGLRQYTTVLTRMIAAMGVLAIIGAVWVMLFPPFYRVRPTPPAPPEAWLTLLVASYWTAFWILTVGSLVLGVVLLFKYHALLGEALARMPTHTGPRP